MRILFLNNDGGGFADYIEVDEGTTVSTLFDGRIPHDRAEDYLIRAQEAANFFDNEGRKEGMRQFLDEKSYKPGLGAYDKGKNTGRG